MYNEGALQSVVDPMFYYPAATDYGYICTGLESPINLEDHHMIFGMDGQEAQYAGVQTDISPYVHYQPSYAYEQSLYNPYNPYIPGAVFGLDGSLIGMQQFYAQPYYEIPASSPTYYPVVLQPGSDNFSNSITEPLLYTGALNVSIADERTWANRVSSASTAMLSSSRPTSNQRHSTAMASEDPKANSEASKLSLERGTISSNSFSNLVSQNALQGRGSQPTDTISHGKAFPCCNLLKASHSSSIGLSSFGSRDHGQTTTGKIRTKLQYKRVASDVNASSNVLKEQSIDSGTKTTKNHLALKDYTTNAGISDAGGNNLVCAENYKKNDSSLDYVNAKFFVIKSFTEDDVHKSIKYNVWSSTTSGNKKLQRAYEDAQVVAGGDPRGCPIMLFFSVNSSGHFCGVAEMIGPVDFHKDMDFWHQDKWNGSFPVKWHMIKDVPNSSFRHIILENNEYRPVTHSRDTQEIWYNQGTEMLKVYKEFVSRTSLVDDFMYYEDREKIIQQSKMQKSSFYMPVLTSRKQNVVADSPPPDRVEETHLKGDEHGKSSKLSDSSADKENGKPLEVDAKDGDVSSLNIGSLTINPKQIDTKHLDATSDVDTEADTARLADAVPDSDVVTGPDDSPGVLRFGTVHLDPRALQLVNEACVTAKISGR